jgi:Protein of unknown function (DUF1566)
MQLHPTTPQVPTTHGTPFEGGFYGGQIRIGAALFAVVWAPKAQGEIKGKWLDSYTDVPGAGSYFNSMANTVAMAAAGSALARQALALDINGITDWRLPARDVLELAYRHLKPATGENYVYRSSDNPSSVPVGYPYTDILPTQTTAEAFQKGGAEAFEEEWYWSSTQHSDISAWLQNFSYGYQLNDGKSYAAQCRAVRLIQLST